MNLKTIRLERFALLTILVCPVYLLSACSDAKLASSSANPEEVTAPTPTPSTADGSTPVSQTDESQSVGTSYFADIDALDRASIYKVVDGKVSEIFSGSPLSIPTSVAVSSDGQTLYIADVGAVAADGSETGAIFALSAAGGSPAIIATNDFRWPVEIAVADGGKLAVLGEDDRGMPKTFELLMQ